MVAIDLIVQHVHSQLEEVRKFTNTHLITYTFLHTLVHTKKNQLNVCGSYKLRRPL